LAEESRHRDDLFSCCRNLATRFKNSVIISSHSTTRSEEKTSCRNPAITFGRFCRSRRQRYRRAQEKRQQQKATLQASRERTDLKRKHDNITHSINCRIQRKFGFLAADNLSVHLNARHALGNTHPADYFAQANKLAFHDLTQNNELPTAANQLLGLGLKYIPTPKINITKDDIDRSLTRFERDMGLRIFFSGDDTDDSYDPSVLRGSSKWRAPLPPREIDNRICEFQQEIERRFVRRRTIPNLSSFQEKILHSIRQNKNVVILSADKGLGPVGVSTKQYVEWGLKHLTDSSTYTILHNDQAHQIAEDLFQSIFQWTRTHRQELEDDTTKYIREHIEKARQDPFGYFYMLAKLHKTPISTRPVCSDCASLPHSVGKWVDRQLQPIVQRQRTYFKNSFELKNLLDTNRPSSTECMFVHIRCRFDVHQHRHHPMHPTTNIIPNESINNRTIPTS
jgi:hypothetical protein